MTSAPRSGTPAGAPLDARVRRTRADVTAHGLHLLVTEGWDGITHGRLAQAAGYSRATLYTHWPSRADLLREIVEALPPLPHVAPTGDLRHDLVAELTVVGEAVRTQRLDRVLAVLATLVGSRPELLATRDRLVADVESTLRTMLRAALPRARAEHVTRLLTGAVLGGAVAHGEPPRRAALVAMVDVVVDGLAASGLAAKGLVADGSGADDHRPG